MESSIIQHKGGYTQLYLYDEIGFEDYLVFSNTQQNTIYELPGFKQLGTIEGQYINHVQLSKTEYGWLIKDSPSPYLSEADLYLKIDSALVFQQSFSVTTDENHLLPIILSVSRNFFNDDQNYEIVYRIFNIDNNDPDFGYKLSFVNENYEQFFETTGDRIRLIYGTCGESNEFMIGEGSSSSDFQAQ